MTVRFLKSWRGWNAGDTGGVGPGISGPNDPTEEELVDRGIAEYVTTDTPEASPKSEPETRERLEQMADETESRREEIDALDYRDGGEGLYGRGHEVAAHLGVTLEDVSGDGLRAFLLDNFKIYQELTDDSEE